MIFGSFTFNSRSAKMLFLHQNKMYSGFTLVKGAEDINIKRKCFKLFSGERLAGSKNVFDLKPFAYQMESFLKISDRFRRFEELGNKQINRQRGSHSIVLGNKQMNRQRGSHSIAS